MPPPLGGPQGLRSSGLSGASSLTSPRVYPSCAWFFQVPGKSRPRDGRVQRTRSPVRPPWRGFLLPIDHDYPTMNGSVGEQMLLAPAGVLLCCAWSRTGQVLLKPSIPKRKSCQVPWQSFFCCGPSAIVCSGVMAQHAVRSRLTIKKFQKTCRSATDQTFSAHLLHPS
jgi:hypothetical protein